MKDIFQIVKKFKKIKIKTSNFNGYYNMIYQYGENNFIKNVNSGVMV